MDVLDAEATAAALPYDALPPAIEKAIAEVAAGQIAAPERSVLALPGGRYLVMPAADDTLAITKIISVHSGNPDVGLPAIQGQVFVSDAVTGRPLLVLDGPTVTARRTAAVSMVGMRTLHSGPITRVAIVGAGAQAKAHALAIHEVFGAAIDIVARNRDRGEALCGELHAFGVSAKWVATVDVDPEAQVVVTATTSRTPVLPDVLPAHVLIVAIGAFTPEMVEVPAAIVHRRRILVDTVDGARHEAGDLIQANVSWPRVRSLAACFGHPRPVVGVDLAKPPDRTTQSAETDIGWSDWVVSSRPRAGPSLNVLFKTVGHAAWDLAASRVAVQTRA